MLNTHRSADESLSVVNAPYVSSSPFVELRSFVSFLERSGRLHRVTKSVDKDWELACIARWALESTAEKDAYAIFFEHVGTPPNPVVVNLYSTPEMYAAALGTYVEDIFPRWAKALEHPRQPIVVTSAACQEFVSSGSDIDLLSIPAPVWTPGKDAGPYLSAANVVTKDPETGIQNVGIYRMQIHDSRHAGLYFGGKMQHGAIHRRMYAERQEPMPVAAVVGVAPAVTFAAAAKLPYGVDELAIAGGLGGFNVEVVPGKSVDLLVPARAECVIEGFVRPELTQMEGPFGEYLGYVNSAAPAAVVEITAITHRLSPLHHGFVQQMPPSDGHLVMEMGTLGPLWSNLTRKLKLEGLRDLAIARGSAGLSILAAQIRKTHVSEAVRIGRMLAKFNSGQRFIYLVDEDINIRDQETLNWALSSRVNAAEDIEFVESFSRSGSQPSRSTAVDGEERVGADRTPPVVIINATSQNGFGGLSLPSAQMMFNVLNNWGKTGLPPLHPRERLKLLLTRS